jgi:thiol:disulfide interchange protein DsbD
VVNLVAGLLGGFAALLMPCIFPMLPMTVSFFTKQASSKSNGITKSLVYGLSIIVIYVALGLLITVFFGADALNDLSTNGIFNLVFFVMLIVFAAPFLAHSKLCYQRRGSMPQIKAPIKADIWGFSLWQRHLR